MFVFFYRYVDLSWRSSSCYWWVMFFYSNYEIAGRTITLGHFLRGQFFVSDISSLENRDNLKFVAQSAYPPVNSFVSSKQLLFERGGHNSATACPIMMSFPLLSRPIWPFLTAEAAKKSPRKNSVYRFEKQWRLVIAFAGILGEELALNLRF